MYDDTEQLVVSASKLLKLLSVAEVKAVFGRSSRTVRRWVRQKHLTPIRVGRPLFFQPDDIGRVISDELQSTILAGVHRKT